MKKKNLTLNAILVVAFCMAPHAKSNAQIGEVLWEDNFDTLNTDVWNPIEGNGCEIGLCGWGNQELEYYHPNNISIEAMPNELGNNALVLEAKRETIQNNAFTSGKVDTERKLSIHYGLIEVRMKAPVVETGLWPAVWLLGVSRASWPSKGEIDMMEMGHNVAERMRQVPEGSDINSYVGANVIFADAGGGPASIAYDTDYNKPYVASSSLADRFVTYRLYWEPTEIRLTVIDQGVEYDFYEAPLPIDADGVTQVFTKPFYMLLNLAVGGNFTDATAIAGVTAAVPAKLFIDYVRVYEWNGHGTIARDYEQPIEVAEAETGIFGVFTENPSAVADLAISVDSDIFVWGGTMQEGATPATEGSKVIAWETVNTNSWFGGGVASIGRNMSNYLDNGSLKFKIKIPADVSFRIGITDNFTNEKWLEFPAGETKYGLIRNGEWGQVEIPLIDYAGTIAFQDINYMFAISSIDGSFPTSTFQLAIDDIIWDDNKTLSTAVVNANDVSIKLYPSPANGQVNIVLPGYANFSKVEIFDITGKKVLVQDEITSQVTTIDIHDLVKGMYVVKAYQVNSNLQKSMKLLVK